MTQMKVNQVWRDKDDLSHAFKIVEDIGGGWFICVFPNGETYEWVESAIRQYWQLDETSVVRQILENYGD